MQHGENDDMKRRESRRQHKAVVVGVRHNHSADESCRYAPACRPRVFLRARFCQIFDIAGFGEVLSEKMRSAGLKRFSVLHHCLDAVCVDRAGELFAFRFAAAYYGHRHKFLRKRFVNAQHLLCFYFSLLFGGVRRMAFLPEEFGGAKEKARAHFPSDDVRPLVD